jgi:glutamyl-tRNA synthetase
MEIEIDGVKKGADKTEVQAPVHPDFEERGERTIPVDVNKIIIEKGDYETLKGKEVGLMNLFSVELGVKSKYISDQVKMETPKVHWVSKKHVEAEVVMPDGDRKKVLLEPEIEKTETDDVIQLMRIGFCRVEKHGKDIVLYYAHK